jgi:two-component system sensor histidine kinase AgrC
MITICYLFIFVFEQFVSFIYFNGKFDIKVKPVILLLSYTISFAIQFSINLINIPYLNLLTFLVLNIIIVHTCFAANFKQTVFNVLFLEGIMISTELVIMYFITTILNIKLLVNNELIVFLETAASKALYFLIAYLIAKYSTKENPRYQSDYSMLLFVLPLASIIIIVSFAYLSFNLEIDRTINILFSIISLILLITNIVVIYVHEKTTQTLIKNSELQLEQQKEKINEEYYTNLEKQYDSSNILIHDIKKCLMNIKELSKEADAKEIPEYIDSIYNGYNIKELKQYSKNKLVNVIVSRYANLCHKANIDFLVDIRNVDFHFITDSDLTALLDNLLENAYEAAKSSTEKQIDLHIDYRNENFLLIDLHNTFDRQPKLIGKELVTTKQGSGVHGIGLKSISRIVKRYSGNMNYKYDKDHKVFHTSIMLKLTNI